MLSSPSSWALRDAPDAKGASTTTIALGGSPVVETISAARTVGKSEGIPGDRSAVGGFTLPRREFTARLYIRTKRINRSITATVALIGTVGGRGEAAGPGVGLVFCGETPRTAPWTTLM